MLAAEYYVCRSLGAGLRGVMFVFSICPHRRWRRSNVDADSFFLAFLPALLLIERNFKGQKAHRGCRFNFICLSGQVPRPLLQNVVSVEEGRKSASFLLRDMKK